ncbi:MAG: hypothetical protein AB7L09_24300 [Nitrospira sp.]
MMKLLTLRVVCSLVVLSGFFTTEAHAYIDPGSGSVLLQLILGGIAGIGVVAKLYWDRVRTRCRSLFGKNEE